MKVNVVYMSQVKTAAGISGESVPLEPGSTLRDLAGRLSELHGPEFRDLLIDGAGAARPSILYSVNGEQRLTGDRTPLADNDEVLVIAPMSGG